LLVAAENRDAEDASWDIEEAIEKAKKMGATA